MNEGEMFGSASTRLAGISDAVDDTNNNVSVTDDVMTIDSWRSEEAEMPSGGMAGSWPHDRLYHCQYEGCQRLEGFSLKCHLRKHVQTHTLPFKCPICLYRSAEKRGVDRHIKVSHKRLAEELWGPMETHLCTLCGKEFARKDYIKRHLRTKHAK
ncbi:unnamed protein product [Penicillium salamii]|nr:unnamed protein product [Penicillium salamii]